MATRRLSRDVTDSRANNRYIVWFTLSNGKTYYIADGFVFVQIRDNIEFDTFMKCAKKYKLQGAKCVMKLLWDKYFTYKNENDNGGHIVKSTFGELKDVERRLKYYTNNKYYFNHTL